MTSEKPLSVLARSNSHCVATKSSAHGFQNSEKATKCSLTPACFIIIIPRNKSDILSMNTCASVLGIGDVAHSLNRFCPQKMMALSSAVRMSAPGYSFTAAANLSVDKAIGTVL